MRAATFAYLNDIEAKYNEIGLQLDSAYLITAENAWVATRSTATKATRHSAPNASMKTVKVPWLPQPTKPVSRFYNAIPANDYDIVLNPEILEPTVQFSTT
ncbi:MAG: hypothetical protein IPM36_11485 [Lewinellaceae bacterium]|nr:hypothetical protein [Lewinellaceae bacterium]